MPVRIERKTKNKKFRKRRLDFDFLTASRLKQYESLTLSLLSLPTLVQMIDDLLAGPTVGHFLHKLQQRHPSKQHRIYGRPAIILAVKRAKPCPKL